MQKEQQHRHQTNRIIQRTWACGQSTYQLVIPAGTKVTLRQGGGGKVFYLVDEFGWIDKENQILRHDAIHYGISIDECDIEVVQSVETIVCMTEEHQRALDDACRDGAVTDVALISALQGQFPEITKSAAATIIRCWVELFSTRHPSFIGGDQE